MLYHTHQLVLSEDHVPSWHLNLRTSPSGRSMSIVFASHAQRRLARSRSLDTVDMLQLGLRAEVHHTLGGFPTAQVSSKLTQPLFMNGSCPFVHEILLLTCCL